MYGAFDEGEDAEEGEEKMEEGATEDDGAALANEAERREADEVAMVVKRLAKGRTSGAGTALASPPLLRLSCLSLALSRSPLSPEALCGRGRSWL